MTVRINSLSDIKKKLGIDKNGDVSKYMVETCYRHMDKYVPMDESNLRKNVYLDSNSITYMSPYARYQYNGILYVDPVYGKRGFSFRTIWILE